MFKTSTLTEWNKSKSKPTQVRFADLFFKCHIFSEHMKFVVQYNMNVIIKPAKYAVCLQMSMIHTFSVGYRSLINNISG